MRIILRLLLLAWIIWLMYRVYKYQQRKDQISSTGRKKVESKVIEKEEHDKDSSDEKPQE